MTALEWASLAVVVVLGGVNVWLGLRAEFVFRLFMAREGRAPTPMGVRPLRPRAPGPVDPAEQARKGP